MALLLIAVGSGRTKLNQWESMIIAIVVDGVTAARDGNWSRSPVHLVGPVGCYRLSDIRTAVAIRVARWYLSSQRGVPKVIRRVFLSLAAILGLVIFPASVFADRMTGYDRDKFAQALKAGPVVVHIHAEW